MTTNNWLASLKSFAVKLLLMEKGLEKAFLRLSKGWSLKLTVESCMVVSPVTQTPEVALGLRVSSATLLTVSLILQPLEPHDSH